MISSVIYFGIVAAVKHRYMYLRKEKNYSFCVHIRIFRISVPYIPFAKDFWYKYNVTLFQLSGSLTIVTACSTFLLIIQIFTPKVVAMRKLPDADEFMIENQRTRTHTRQNYVFQRDRDEEMSGGMENTGPAYVTEPLDPDPNPEELPALIVDYANMIRNDIILLDNSVETRTRKRGNVRSKYDDVSSLTYQCNDQN